MEIRMQVKVFTPRLSASEQRLMEPEPKCKVRYAKAYHEKETEEAQAHLEPQKFCISTPKNKT